MRKLLYLILIFAMIICIIPINIYADSNTSDIIITDMSDEEIEAIMQIQFFGTTSQTQIAKWKKCIDNTKADINEHSVIYYYPIYEGIHYNKYYTLKQSTNYVIIYYNDATTMGSPINMQDGKCIVIKTKSETAMKDYLFDETIDRTETSASLCETTTSTYYILGGNYSYTNYFNETNHADTFYIWYQDKNLTSPPLLDDNGKCITHTLIEIKKVDATCTKKGGTEYQCNICAEVIFEETEDMLEHTYEDNICTVCGHKKESSSEDSGLIAGWIDSLKEYLNEKFSSITSAFEAFVDLFKIQNGTIVFDKAGELINEKLEDNKFYTSLVSIKNTLSDLYNEDYSSRTGFYELGLTNLTLRKVRVEKTINHGNEVIGDWEQSFLYKEYPIDWGLNNVKILNLDWYFGEDLGNGYYVKGVKDYTDVIVGSFMWLVFGWALYKNLPAIINGELTSITSMVSGVNNAVERQINIEDLENQKAKERELKESQKEKRYKKERKEKK